MNQLTDWKRCYALWGAWMYHEAAESCYDARAADAAKEPYLKESIAYLEKYGVLFNPECEPETSILEDIEELGQRLLYGKYLDSCRGPAVEFEEWVASGAAA
ncbi:hypothetical protein [Fimbriiglobus ruber]|uniref:Uncharacterized protein n=1 Tax=Fimbriiglobus ruber TaxID=1908690 RepID=A0A225DD51_9BACT|nr:hypothetical protein [Fimbriiglobus ruber]OWK39471.1 hypothetical protein FRUB_06034 [Fimbriiglobus ruber]